MLILCYRLYMTIVDVTSSGNTKTYTLRRFYAVYGRDRGNSILDGTYSPTLVAVKRIVNQHVCVPSWKKSTHLITKRRFVDAPTDQRCHATIMLKDRTTAQCGRYAKIDGLCHQHKKIADGYAPGGWTCGAGLQK